MKTSRQFSTNLDAFLALGSWSPQNIKTEMYSFVTNAWTEVDDYPYGGKPTDGMRAYEMIYISEASSYFVIGGKSGEGELSQIARFGVLGSPPFATGQWYNAGKLNRGRVVSSRSSLFLPNKNGST